jgi:hypothetical protein
MKTLIAAALGLAAFTSAAFAEPAEPIVLTDEQMDQVSAGFAGSADDPFFFDIPRLNSQNVSANGTTLSSQDVIATSVSARNVQAIGNSGN